MRQPGAGGVATPSHFPTHPPASTHQQPGHINSLDTSAAWTHQQPVVISHRQGHHCSMRHQGHLLGYGELRNGGG